MFPTNNVLVVLSNVKFALPLIFPATDKSLMYEKADFPKMMVIKALGNSDQRIADNKPVTLYFLIAALLWEPMLRRAKEKIAKGLPESNAYYEAASETLTQQVRRIAIPRHLTLAIREVWNLQPKFNARVGAKPSRLLTQANEKSNKPKRKRTHRKKMKTSPVTPPPSAHDQ